jgi:glucose-6-phosphate 1-dehydrogenase
MDFDYSTLFGVTPPEAYSRLLLDAMLGDQTLFERNDNVVESWKILEPVLQAFKAGKSTMFKYPAGQSDLLPADIITFNDDKKWYDLKI